MAWILRKKDFPIKPESRLGPNKLIIATASNAKAIHEQLIENVPDVGPEFFREDKNSLYKKKDKLQHLFNVSDRTFQYWKAKDGLKPKKCHLAISLLSLDMHPDMKLERKN